MDFKNGVMNIQASGYNAGTFISPKNVKLKNCSDFLCEHHQRRESSDDGFFFFHLAFAPERITLYHKHIAKKGRKLACVLLDCKEILSSWVFLELATMYLHICSS